MNTRRNFLKTSALGLIGAPLAAVASPAGDDTAANAPTVKQPEDCETYYVRENTPITFNICKTTDNIGTVSVMTEEIVPGGAIPEHKHLNEDEFFIFTSGTGAITIDEASFTFKPGTTGFVPKNTWHSIKNTGADKVVFSFGYTPSGFEGFFKEVGTPKGQPFKQKPKAEVDAIAKKYGMVFR